MIDAYLNRRKEMKLICCFALAFTFSAASFAVAPADKRYEWTRSSESQTVRSKRNRKARAVKKTSSSKSVTQPSATSEVSPDPITPNRVEIDPGDIPASERPRNPNVDDRTKIPETIDRGDRVPPKNIPKTKPRKNCRPSNHNAGHALASKYPPSWQPSPDT